MDERTVDLAIEGMHCGACVRRVTMALEKLEGVEVVHVGVGSAEVKLAGAEIPVEAILDAVGRLGFTAKRT
ncbi:MAG TPA: heavy metal-associated domain-containing protein [Bryobacteraceae bacterium]|nr:heavy metal-associated domain-containing protein [Bryobacteraceae bacterium]HPT27678.1 heavy metal-associated domain-containing protein [Bryobacteraceae bacterium]